MLVPRLLVEPVSSEVNPRFRPVGLVSPESIASSKAWSCTPLSKMRGSNVSQSWDGAGAGKLQPSRTMGGLEYCEAFALTFLLREEAPKDGNYIIIPTPSRLRLINCDQRHEP